MQELTALGVGFVSVTEALDLTTPAGRAMAGLLSVFAEFERDIMRERVRAGLAHARLQGTRLGRPPTAAAEAGSVSDLFLAGISKSEIARRLKSAERRSGACSRKIIPEFGGATHACRKDTLFPAITQRVRAVARTGSKLFCGRSCAASTGFEPVATPAGNKPTKSIPFTGSSSLIRWIAISAASTALISGRACLHGQFKLGAQLLINPGEGAWSKPTAPCYGIPRRMYPRENR